MSPDLREFCDVAVVGAWPAGLAAADLCARAGLETLLLDEQADPGGQIYRAVTASPLAPGTILGDDYWRGAGRLQAARIMRLAQPFGRCRGRARLRSPLVAVRAWCRQITSFLQPARWSGHSRFQAGLCRA